MTVCVSTDSPDCCMCQPLCNLGLCQCVDRSISGVLVALRDTLLGPLVTKTHRELSGLTQESTLLTRSTLFVSSPGEIEEKYY